jgi:hypothetical protein
MNFAFLHLCGFVNSRNEPPPLHRRPACRAAGDPAVRQVGLAGGRAGGGRCRRAGLPEQANREVCALLKDGIPVSVPDAAHGRQKIERLCVIEWAQPQNNDFLLVSQLSITGALYTCRPDLIGFVNGLPWVVIELTCSPRWLGAKLVTKSSGRR